MCSCGRCVGHLLPRASSIMLDYKDDREKYQVAHTDMYFLISLCLGKGVQTTHVSSLQDGLGLWPPAAADPLLGVHVLC